MSKTPFKMKYTDGKKANPSSFPFKVETPKTGGSPLELSRKAKFLHIKKIEKEKMRKKKADPSAFPLVNDMIGGPTSKFLGGMNTSKDMKGGTGVRGTEGGGIRGAGDMIAAKIDEKVEEKVDKVVNQKGAEGLV